MENGARVATDEAFGCTMTPERWQRLKSLFQAAVEMPQHKRSSFVAQACGRDSELRRQLASLVDAHARETRPDIDPIVRLREVFRFDAPQFSEGEVLLGRFQIVRLLGSGGMGDVYEPNDLELGRIALKTIRPDVAGDPQILSRFKTEVQLARRISDRHVCRIYEMFVVPDPVEIAVDGIPHYGIPRRDYASGAYPKERVPAMAGSSFPCPSIVRGTAGHTWRRCHSSRL